MEAVSEQLDSKSSPLLFRLIAYLLWGFGIVAAALMLVPFTPEMPAVGLDPSWRMALNVALTKGLVFGKDIVFTFGPLGPVYTQLYSPATDAFMMWASAFYALAFAAVFGLAAYPRKVLLGIALPMLVALCPVRDPLFTSIPLLLLLGTVRTCVPEESPLHLRATWIVNTVLALATIAVGMTPIIKGSFVGASIPLVGLSFVVLWGKSGRLAFAFGILFLVSMAGWWMIAGQSIADLVHFFSAQSPIVSGYTEAMSLHGAWSGLLVYILASLILCFVVWQAVCREASIPGYALLLGVAWSLFISFKSGFVRHDGHALISGGALLLVAFAVACLTTWSKGFFIAVVSLVAAGLSVRSGGVPIDWSFPRQRIEFATSSTLDGIRLRLSDDSVLERKYISAIESIRKSDPLPGISGDVDIYPWDLGALFANGLDWTGRPVFQSYSAYTPSLLKLNADHLLGNYAPKNVLFKFEPLDGRLPALDDSSSILALLSRYRIQGYEAPYVHFIRASTPNDVGLLGGLAHSEVVKWGQEVAIPDSGPIWVSVDLDRSYMGRAVEGLFKLPLTEIDLTLEDGTIAKHRYVPEIGRNGFIVSPHLVTGMDLVNLAAGIPSAPVVKSFKLVTSTPVFWRKSFKVTMTPIAIASQSDARSLVAEAPRRVLPTALGVRDARVTQCSIDAVNNRAYRGNPVQATDASTLSVAGWIEYPNGVTASDFETWFIATSTSGEASYFAVQRLPRPDVAQALNRPDLIDSGFTATLDVSSLPRPHTFELVAASKSSAFKCSFALTIK